MIRKNEKETDAILVPETICEAPNSDLRRDCAMVHIEELANGCQGCTLHIARTSRARAARTPDSLL